MKKVLLSWLVCIVSVIPGWSASKEQQRITDAGNVVKAVAGMPEGIPANLLEKARCVVVLPSVKKFAIGIGGSYGRGVMTCRGGADFKGPWSAPAMFALEGGNIGFQLGGQEADFVLLIMNEDGARSVMSSKVKLGADASAAAGPVGRDSTAATDVVLKTQILSYSRSRGLFAGVSLEGSTLRNDGDANKNLYGKDYSAKQILQEGIVKAPASARPLLATLSKYRLSAK